MAFDWNTLVAQVDTERKQAAQLGQGAAPGQDTGASGAPPAPAATTPPDAPSQAPTPAGVQSPAADNPWAAAVAQVAAQHQAEARGATFSAITGGTSPDTAARALQLQQQTGIPASVAEANMPEAERQAALIQSNAALAQDPELARWIAANPLAARVASDDYDQLSYLGKTLHNLAAGWTGGQLSYERGGIGNDLQLGVATPEERQRLAQIDEQLSQEQAADPGWGVQGAIRGASNFASGTLDNALAALGTGVAAAGVGAAGGAIVGSLGAGVGALPGAAAGAESGFRFGFQAGFKADMARVAAGNAYADLDRMQDANGQSIDEAAKQGAALLTGLGTYALGGVGAESIGRGMSSLFGSTVREAATRPTLARALANFGTAAAKGAGTGALINGGMDVVNEFAQQSAKALSSGDFPSAFNDAGERQAAVQRLVSSMLDGAQLFGAMHALPGTVGLYTDTLRARQATADVQGFQALEQGATDSATRTRAPSVFQDWLQRQANGSPVENLFIPGDVVRSLYQDAGATPGTGDGLLGFVPDLDQQLQQSDATGGDIVVPTADYITHLAGTDVSQRLLPDIRVRQDAMSLNQAQAFDRDYRGMLDDRVQRQEAEFAQQQAARAPVQQVFDDVQQQARQAGLGADAAQQYASLFAARYEARGTRMGQDPLDLYRRENISIQADLPESIQALPADGLDAALAGLRAGRKPLTEAQLYGESLMPFLAKRGGVVDDGGELAAMGADTWHVGKPGMPRFVRPAEEDAGPALPGMGGGDTPKATTHGLDASTLAAWEAGYLPSADRPETGALLDAVRQEMGGEKVYSDRQGNARAQAQEAAMADLQETLDRHGLDPRTSSNADIRTALYGARPESGSRGYEQPVFHGSPHVFDRFDSSRIGTGEGAQAFGHGLYFAGKKDVAAWYRKALSEKAGAGLFDNDGGGYLAPHDPANEGAEIDAHQLLVEHKGDYAAAFRAAAPDDAWSPEHAARVADLLRQMQREGVTYRATEGRLYHVEIPDDGAYLDWDRPLSEQPEAVRDALRQHGIEAKGSIPLDVMKKLDTLNRDIDAAAGARADALIREKNALLASLGDAEDMTGRDAYQQLAAQLARQAEAPDDAGAPQGWGAIEPTRASDPAAASAALREAGVPGIKYLDQGSRGTEGGTHNYVVFDDRHAEIRSYEQAAEPVARITGEEIAPRTDDLDTLRAKAREFYERELKGTSVHSSALDRDVRFQSGRKTFSSAAMPDKLRAFAALREVIRDGKLDASVPPRDPKAQTNVKMWHRLSATVELDGQPRVVGVTVREDNNGRLYYNHTISDEPLPGEDAPAASSAAGRLEGGVLDDNGRTYEQKVGEPADGVNMQLRPLDQPDGATFGRARGRIDFEEGRTVIRLFAQRNLSTLLHEGGHQFLDELARDAADPTAPEQVREDMAAVSKWLGVKDATEIGTEQHEQFARGFEAYLMEGKAPAPGLEGAFARFKSWLLAIYKSVSALRVEVSPEIREVFSRLIATDEQIEQARDGARLQRLFGSAAEGVMTDREFAAYEAAADAAKGQAERTLLEKTMGDVRRQRTKAWQDEAAGVRADVTSEVDSRPEMRAMELLRNGRPRGSDAEAVRMRLSKPDLEAMFGPGVTDALPRSVPPMFAETGGVHPDEIAEMVGLRSGDELVRKLMSVGEQQRRLREAGDRRGVRAAEIERETQARMVERHGDVLHDGSIEEEAQSAVHNEMQLRAMGIELQALGRRFRDAPRGRDEMQVVRSWAARTIGEKRVADATAVHLYARAEAKAANAAFDALDKAKPRPEEAYRQQRARMLNHALFIEAKKASADADRAQKMMQRYAAADTMKGMDQGALDQIHGLLERMDFGRVSNAEVQRRQSLAAWVEGQRAQGLEPAVPDRLLDDAFRQHYSQMTMNDLRGLSDAVGSIAHLGRLKQQLLDRKAAREFDTLVQEAVDTAGKLPQREVDTRRNPGVGGTGLDRLKAKVGTAASAFRMADASMLKMEQVFQWLDGNDPSGVFNRVVFRRLADAQTAEAEMQRDIAGKLRALNDAVPKQRRAELDRIRSVPELPYNRTGKPAAMTKSELLAVALNTGNDGNLTKMLAGENWTHDQVRAALDRNLTADDWRFVQGVWDTVESLWPQIAALEKRVSGVEPEKVERTPVETAHGTFAGGYYPIVYDPLRSFDVEQNRQRSGAALFENNYTRATTSQGHTISRVDNYARPLLLSLDVLPRHLNAVIHDITHREAIMDADRFLAAPRVRGAVEGALGREVYQQFRPWLQSVANDRAIDPRGLAFWDKLAHAARTNATIVGLGFRLSTMIVHGTSAALNSVAEAGAMPMAKAVGAFMKDPKGMRDFVFEKSGEMRNRLDTVDRDMRDALRDLHDDHGPLATVQRFSMMGVAMLDMASALPTWVAAHTEALKAGMDEDDAVYAADQSVRNAHGAAGAKDHSAIQRGSETQKLFTMFYSFWNHLYNRQRDLYRDVKSMRSIGDFGSVLARSFFYLVAPPVIHGLIAGGASKPNADGEEEGWASWAAKGIGLGLVSGIPVVRDVAGALEHGQEYRMSPAADAIVKAGAAGKDVARALGMMDGEPSDRWVRHAIETPGYFLGLPTGQAGGAGQFLWDSWNGDEDPQSVGDWLHGLMYGPAPKGAH